MNPWRVTFEDGTSYDTSLAAHVTQKEADAYFLDQYINMGAYPVEDMKLCVKVEQLTLSIKEQP